MSNSDESWVPRCPANCGLGNVILAPANGFTKFLIAQVEVYCTNCGWRGKLADHIKMIYVRM